MNKHELIDRLEEISNQEENLIIEKKELYEQLKNGSGGTHPDPDKP